MLSLGIDLTKEKMDLTLLRGPHFRGLLQAFANEKEPEVLSRPHLLVVLTPIDAAQKTTNFKQALGTDIDDLMERGGQPRRWWEP